MAGVPIAVKAAIHGKVTGAGDTPVLVDVFGNMLVRQAAPASGVTIGTLTAAGQSVTCTTAAGYQEVLVTLSGTYGVFQMAVELSDDGGTTWFKSPMAQEVTSTGTFYPNDASTANFGAANATKMYRVPTYGAGQIRVRAAGGPGSGVCTVRITLIPFGTPHGAFMQSITLDSSKALNIATPQTSLASRPLFSTDNSGALLGVSPYLYSGLSSTFDAARGLENIAVLASASRTATTTANLTFAQNCAILVVVDVTARASATTLTPSLLMGNTTTTNVANKTIWTAAAAINTASGTTMYAFWPFPTIAVPTGFAEVVNLPIFREMQLVCTPNDANSLTYRVNIYTAAVG